MSKRIDIFQKVLNEFESEEIKSFCIDVLENLPQNFWSMETKYNDNAGGLVKQTLIGALVCNSYLSDKNYREVIDKAKKRDCIRTAVILRYIYPHYIIEKKVEHDIKKGLREYIAKLVEDYKTVDKIENRIVLMSDIESKEGRVILSKVELDNIKEVALPDPENYFFGPDTPYNKINFWLVYEMDRKYLEWLKDSIQYIHISEPLRSYLRKYV